jgi:uncharacterized membrane protein YeaQ/YmgE (transglycosylase-associated protein family)
MTPGIIGWIVFGLLGGYVAAHKGYPPKWGILAGVILGPIGIVIAALLPTTAEGRETANLDYQIRSELAHSQQTQPCPVCGRKNSVIAQVCPQCDHRFGSNAEVIRSAIGENGHELHADDGTRQ